MKKILLVIVSVFVVASITGCGEPLEPELILEVELWISRADASEEVARAHAGEETGPFDILESWMENPVAVEEKYIT